MTPFLLAAAFLLPSTAPSTPPTAGPPTPLTAAPAQPGAVWPLTPRPEVVRGFEPPPKPWLPGHRGLDLRGSPGQQVRSATSGTVTYAGPLAGRGVIVITDGPLRTTYEPVIPTVRKGTHVTPGTPLGHLSAAASHCTPATCLHWGLLQATTYLNPLTLLPHRPVRLLPNTPHRAPPLHPTNTPTDPADTQPSGTPQPRPPQRTQPTAQASPQGGLASTVVVGLAAAATLIGSILIRRH
ncbi:M23 family metallopeptidase [Kribbella sp. NBC_00382]|uniref:M23 family metallopeptidase n=1 Tax=Kribbella sp. NBC_00382 TaxID=2975967 RepID=UPI002E1F3869